jgi:dihydrolipoamide dehydrogenase
MKEYDVIMVGSGSGMTVVDGAVRQGLKVALVEKGPLGGTCLNVGCIPSKMLVFPADRVMEIQEAKKLGIHAEVKRVDFAGIMDRMRRSIRPSSQSMRKGITQVPNLDLFETEGRFVGKYTMEVDSEKIRGKQVFLASGARPFIPPIQGIQECEYLTNDTVFDLMKQPKHLVIVGGGYIAAEFGHFFAAVGTKVTILQRGPRLVRNEEPEISALLFQEMKKRMTIHVNTEVNEVQKNNGGYTLVGRDVRTGERQEVTGETILLAAGRKSNADVLKAEKTGVKTDARGYIVVNNYLETSQSKIWAWGDAIGKQMFRHVANEESEIVWHNANHKQKVKMDYRVIPHAVFSYPQIASVGLTEMEAKQHYDILVGVARYSDVAKGEAMMEEHGFAKAIVEHNSGKILGFHIIGPYAPMLIQEVIDVMSLGGTVSHLAHGMHIHPALPEVVLRAFGNLQHPH